MRELVQMAVDQLVFEAVGAVVQPVVEHAHQQAAALAHRQQTALGVVKIFVCGVAVLLGDQITVRVPRVRRDARALGTLQAAGRIVAVNRRPFWAFFPDAVARRVVGIGSGLAILCYAGEFIPAGVGIAALDRFAFHRDSFRYNIPRGIVGVGKRGNLFARAVEVCQPLHAAQGVVFRLCHAAVRARYPRHVALHVVFIQCFAAVAARHLRHAAERVVFVENRLAVRIRNRRNLAVFVVDIAHRGAECVRVGDEPPGGVIRERAVARRVAHRHKIAVRVVGNCHARFPGAVAFLHQPVERVVIVKDLLAAGQRGTYHVARRVVAVGRRLALGVGGCG